MTEPVNEEVKRDAIVSLWKTSRLFPTKISSICAFLSFVLFVPWIFLLEDTLGGVGGTAGMGLVLLYLPVFAIGFLGFALSSNALFVNCKKSEKKIATISLVFSSITLIPAVILFFYLLQVFLGLR